MLFSVVLLFVTKLVRYQKISGDDVKLLSKHVRFSSMKDEDDCPTGLVVGKWFVGHANSQGKESDGYITLLITFASYDLIFSKEEIVEDKPITRCNLWVRKGNFHFLRYSKQSMPLTADIPKESQKRVVDAILETYDKKGHCVALLAGNPGCGKSSVAHFLLSKLASIKKVGNFTKTFSLTDPGDFIYTLQKSVGPKPNSPLVVLLDEIDITISAIHQGIPQHKTCPIWVKNKADWNSLFDDIDKGLIESVIVIMTTNKSLQGLDDIDPSYTREGRVDVKVTM
mgnify:CR=1 FL=1